MKEIPKELEELYLNDPTVAHCFQSYRYGDYTLEDTLIVLVKILAKQKKETLERSAELVRDMRVLLKKDAT